MYELCAGIKKKYLQCMAYKNQHFLVFAVIVICHIWNELFWCVYVTLLHQDVWDNIFNIKFKHLNCILCLCTCIECIMEWRVLQDNKQYSTLNCNVLVIAFYGEKQ